MRVQLAVSALTLLLCSCAKSTPELECPAPTSGQDRGTLGETTPQIAAAAERLGRGSENEVRGEVASLRTAHPDVSNGAVVNYLLTAYCPKVKADPSLSRAGKQAALKAFSQRAETIVGGS